MENEENRDLFERNGNVPYKAVEPAFQSSYTVLELAPLSSGSTLESEKAVRPQAPVEPPVQTCCPRCGHEISPIQTFCVSCGLRLQKQNMPSGGQQAVLQSNTSFAGGKRNDRVRHPQPAFHENDMFPQNRRTQRIPGAMPATQEQPSAYAAKAPKQQRPNHGGQAGNAYSQSSQAESYAENIQYSNPPADSNAYQYGYSYQPQPVKSKQLSAPSPVFLWCAIAISGLTSIAALIIAIIRGGGI